MNREDIYSAVQAYLEKNKSNFTNKNDIKTHIQDLVGKRISLKNIKMVGEKE